MRLNASDFSYTISLIRPCEEGYVGGTEIKKTIKVQLRTLVIRYLSTAIYPVNRCQIIYRDCYYFSDTLHKLSPKYCMS
jgi:hypothetical protein